MNVRAFPGSSRRRGRHGMVLFEVVIALGIFATAAFALVLALDSAFDAAADRNRIDMAIRGLNNQIALLHSGRVSPGEQDVPDDGTGIAYHISITQEDLKDQKNASLANMYRATISAKWTAHNQPDERDISELIYQP